MHNFLRHFLWRRSRQMRASLASWPPYREPRPLVLGPVRIERPVILAPMSGVTDLPFRRAARARGTPMVVSEMIASQAMVRENRQTLKMAEVDGFGAPSAVQLAGCEPAVMA